jgi:methionyl-tRNA formyltransferase
LKAIVLTSNKLRHKFLLKVINDNFDLLGAIYEDKGAYYDKQMNKSILVSKHFERLSKTEKDFFEKDVKNLNLNNTEIKSINKNEINNEDIVGWAKELNPDVIFLFGTGILENNWLHSFENKIINIHLGLSPFYKGSATLFWPFVNDELECIGATIHLAVKKVDAGGILERIKPNISKDDDYYSINYKTIKKAILILPQIVKSYLDGELKPMPQIKSTTKVYKKADFNEEVLQQVLNKYANNIPTGCLIKLNESKVCCCQ